MEILAALLIHVVVPGLGFLFYLRLREQMRHSQIPSPPTVKLFFILLSYGGWIMVFLTGLFWQWSGLATIGLAYLMLVAPIIMSISAYQLWAYRNQSRFHFGLFVANLTYVVFAIGGYLFWFLIWTAPEHKS